MEYWLFIYLFMHMFFLYKSPIFIYLINQWMKYFEYIIIISLKFLSLSISIFLKSLYFSSHSHSLYLKPEYIVS